MIASKMFRFKWKIRPSYRSFDFLNLTVCLLVAWSAARPSTLYAQEQEQQTQTRTPLVLTMPAPLGGTTPQLSPTSQGGVSNVVGAGLTLGTLLDDNAFVANGKRYARYQYYALPTLTLQRTRPQTAWTLDYRGGITIDRNALQANPSLQTATAATADLQHAFGRRLVLELREDYVLTTNPFDTTGPSPSLAMLSGTGQLNSSVAAPAATRIANVSTGNLTYQLTEHSGMGFSGSYSTQHFRSVEATPGVALGLIDTKTTTGRGFYVREISRRQELGFEYQLQDLRFQGDAARTVDQTVFLFDAVTLNTNMTLVLFAGPDCAHIHNNVLIVGSKASTSIVPGINDMWSPAGGAVFTWRGKHAALRLSGQRVVTDGDGSAGAVRATSASAELRKDFTSRWSTGLGYTYSDGRLLEGLANAANERITWANGSLFVERRLTKNVSVRAQYARIRQTSAGTPAPLTTGNHNRAEVEMVYQFTRPWGR